MTQNTDLRSIDFLAFTEIIESGLGIVREIHGGGVLHFTIRSTNATVVVTQHGYAMKGAIIRDDPKGTMVHQLLIAILLSAARNEHHGRKWAFAFRNRQRASQGVAFFCIDEGHFLDMIIEGRLWILGASLALFFFLCLNEVERKGHPPLCECAFDETVFQRSCINGVQRRHRQLQMSILEGRFVYRNIKRTLGSHIKSGRIAVFNGLDVESGLQFLDTKVDLALPIAFDLAAAMQNRKKQYDNYA